MYHFQNFKHQYRIFSNEVSNLHFNKSKFIKVTPHEGFAFDFPVEWMYSTTARTQLGRKLANSLAATQLDCYKTGSPLKIEEVITNRNIWLFCLERCSPNGIHPGEKIIPGI